jgi:alcohol dehydrogenase (cytochrome c)
MNEYPPRTASTPTAGGLLFTADTLGRFLALDSTTGQTLLGENLGDPAGGGVISYAVEGIQ